MIMKDKITLWILISQTLIRQTLCVIWTQNYHFTIGRFVYMSSPFCFMPCQVLSLCFIWHVVCDHLRQSDDAATCDHVEGLTQNDPDSHATLEDLCRSHLVTNYFSIYLSLFLSARVLCYGHPGCIIMYTMLSNLHLLNSR